MAWPRPPFLLVGKKKTMGIGTIREEIEGEEQLVSTRKAHQWGTLLLPSWWDAFDTSVQRMQPGRAPGIVYKATPLCWHQGRRSRLGLKRGRRKSGYPMPYVVAQRGCSSL